MRLAIVAAALGALGAGAPACGRGSQVPAPSPPASATAPAALPAIASASAGADAAPASPPPTFRHLGDCARDLRPTGDLPKDLDALGRLCAPGMKATLAAPVEIALPAGAAHETSFELARGACVRAAVLARGNPTVGGIELVGPRGVVASAAVSDAIGLLAPGGPVCVRDAGAHRIVVRARDGAAAGAALLQVWSAAP